MKQIWKFIIGFVAIILVLSLAMTVGAVVLLVVSIYFGVKYYQSYRADKGSVTPIFKQWWLYTGILAFLFMFAALGSNNTKPTKLTVNETFVTNDNGIATISGKTSPDYDVNIDNIKQTTADSSGKFSFEYNLKDDSKKSLRLEVSKDAAEKTKKSKLIYVKPSDKFLANRTSLAEESSRAAESARQQEEAKAAQKKVEKEQAKDITRLATKPTSEQEVILTQLAEQTFPQKYPYKGSKIHSILGVIQPWTQDGADWYSKYKATIVNAFGAKRDATLEIKITPTSANSGNVSFTDY